MASEAKSPKAPPAWLFKRLINPIMKTILRSPLHGLLSGGLLILQFKGRKSGQKFSTPVAYNRLDGQTVLVMTRSPWWKNLTKSEPVSLRLEGKEVQASPEIIQDNEVVWGYITHFLEEHHNPRRVGIMLAADASREEIRHAVSDLLAVKFTLL